MPLKKVLSGERKEFFSTNSTNSSNFHPLFASTGVSSKFPHTSWYERFLSISPFLLCHLTCIGLCHWNVVISLSQPIQPQDINSNIESDVWLHGNKNVLFVINTNTTRDRWYGMRQKYCNRLASSPQICALAAGLNRAGLCWLALCRTLTCPIASTGATMHLPSARHSAYVH